MADELNTILRNKRLFKIRVRNWDDTEWHAPTVDYMDIGTNAGEKE